jgi:ACS family glucarate transporter-like MFS transporter
MKPVLATRPTAVRYAVLLALCLAALLAYVQRNSIGVAEADMRRDLGLDKPAMGLVMSSFFLGYALLQIPTGYMAQAWGTRRAMPAFTLLGSAALGLTALAGGMPGLLAARIGQGSAQAGLLPCATNSVSRWFPATRRAFASGALGSSMSVGGALGAALAGLLLSVLGWRWLFVLFAFPGLVWAAWFLFWFRDRPEDHPGVNPGELHVIRGHAESPREDSLAAGPTPWLAIFTSPAMVWICGQQFFRAAGYIFYATWFPTFLREARGVSLADSGILTSLPLCGVVAGTLVGGLASDHLLARTGSRRLARQGVAVVSLVLCAAFILAARPVADAWPAVLLITAGSFCSSVGGPCAYAITIDMGGRNVPMVFATMNTAGNVGAMLFPLVVPSILEHAGGWDAVLFTFAGVHLAAAACWLALKPSGTIGIRANSYPEGR